MPPSRKEILTEIKRQKKAYYEHIDKAERYKNQVDRDYALKTAQRIKKEIQRLADKIGEEVDL